MSMDQMGMSMDESSLKGANPFDRRFVDMMIPNHEGAIRMARAELAMGKNHQLHQIAKDVVAAQSREIRSMNAFRKRGVGAPSPAGGVPKDDGMSGMHMGH